MSRLSDIVDVTITRETQSVTQAGFGTPAIISEFLTSKTTPVFVRHRYYGSTTEMIADGWTTLDNEYKAAAIIFSQNPKVDQVMVGRKDAGDATWTDALAAIQIATSNWYIFSILADNASTTIFDIDFVASNSIVFTINAVAVSPVVFITSQALTMAALKTQIESDIATSVVTIDASDPNNRTLIVEVPAGVTSTSVVVTLGTTQPVGAVSLVNEADYKLAAAWAETQMKIFFYSSSNLAILNPSSISDVPFLMRSLAYDRTASCYHTSSQGDPAPAWFETGWPGETLPYNPGAQTWAYKTIAGVASYALTSGERTAILAKNCAIYTETGGVNSTEEGKVASGESIDIIRGIDWLTSRLQTEVFTNLVNTRKIPYTNEGITVIGGTVQSVLEEAAAAGLLILTSIAVTVPLLSTISQANKLARNLPDIAFTALLQGAIHTVEINGTVSV